MSRPLSSPSIPKDVGRLNFHTRQLQRKPLAGIWITPTLINGWTQPDPPWGTMQYRLHKDGSLEFKGHLVPGTTATVAFVLPDSIGLDPSYLPGHDVSFLTDVETGVNIFSIARVVIDSTTGDVTIYFPAT